MTYCIAAAKLSGSVGGKKKSIPSIGEKRPDRRQVACNDRTPARPILEQLRGNVFHEFRDRLKHDQSDAAAANPVGDFGVQHAASKMHLRLQSLASNRFFYRQPALLSVGVTA